MGAVWGTRLRWAAAIVVLFGAAHFAGVWWSERSAELTPPPMAELSGLTQLGGSVQRVRAAPSALAADDVPRGSTPSPTRQRPSAGRVQAAPDEDPVVEVPQHEAPEPDPEPEPAAPVEEPIPDDGAPPPDLASDSDAGAP